MKIVGTHFKKILISAHYSHTAYKSKPAESCFLLFHFLASLFVRKNEHDFLQLVSVKFCNS